MIYGTVVAYGYCTACTTRPFGNSLAVVPLLGKAGYIGLTAFVVNVIVAVVLTVVFRAAKLDNGTDITVQSDYFADVGDPGVQKVVDESEPIH
jgi:SSS family solute:Na+ symporter